MALRKHFPTIYFRIRIVYTCMWHQNPDCNIKFAFNYIYKVPFSGLEKSL